MTRDDFLAHHYNAMTGFPARIAAVTDAIRPWVEGWKSRQVLDAGCGGGALLLALKRLGVDVVGLDVSKPMLQLAADNAKAQGREFSLTEASFESAGGRFPAAFDTVFCIGNSLVGARDDAEMLAWLTGLRDCLSSGGRLLLQILNLTPFLRGSKRLIARRSTEGGEYVRIATPTGDHLTFAVLFLGRDGRTDVEFSQWGAWESERLTDCVRKAAFTAVQIYGSLERSPFDPQQSVDVVLSARRS